MKPKLLLVTSGLGLGGAEALLIDLAVLLRSQDWDVDVASLSPHGHHRETLETLGFQVSDFGMDRGTSRTNLSALVRALAKLRQSEADIVQCWMQHANFVGGLAALFRRSRPTYYGIFSSSMDFANYPPLSKNVFRSAAMLSRNTEGIVYNGIKAAEDHEQAGYSNDKRILVGNSVNFKRFRPCAESRLKIRQQLQIPEKDRVVVIAARNDPQKDWESMLDHRTFNRTRILRA